MSDFNLKFSVRNARLLRAIRRDSPTVAEFARKYDIIYQILIHLLNFKVPAKGKRGYWSKTALKIVDALNVNPEDIWPNELGEIKAKKSTAEMEVGIEEVAQIRGGDTPERQFMQRQLLARWSKNLTPRELLAVSHELNGITFEESGAELNGVTRERARQIRMEAFRKMKRQADIDGVNLSEVLG